MRKRPLSFFFWELKLSALVYIVSFLAGMFAMPLMVPVAAGNPAGFGYILGNNLAVGGYLVFGGLLFVVPSLVYLSITGATMGALMRLIPFPLLTHFPLEGAAYIFASALGVRAGAKMMRWIRDGERADFDSTMRMYAGAFVLFLIVGALVECVGGA